ncbi:conserved hypothetical protein [Magnetococcus marinus MC-1]|uniref:Uncharacterized protein n=2 Tax=Magnetococcus TaxID=162171 RepID=A0L9L8_MAGMM|nr:conserved hypothetical protein [Magnetococcus marinus MC-1]
MAFTAQAVGSYLEEIDMSSELNQLLDGAIATSKQWAEKGWPMTFGRYEVNSVIEARALADTVNTRIEANAYWEDVAEVGEETAEHGEVAKKALAEGNAMKAKQHIFSAFFEERKINDAAPTWGPVFAAVDK